MKFEIIEQLSVPETIAVDKSIHELQRLKKVYGDGVAGNAIMYQKWQ